MSKTPFPCFRSGLKLNSFKARPDSSINDLRTWNAPLSGIYTEKAGGLPGKATPSSKVSFDYKLPKYQVTTKAKQSFACLRNGNHIGRW